MDEKSDDSVLWLLGLVAVCVLLSNCNLRRDIEHLSVRVDAITSPGDLESESE